jgi:hypothetical protein
MANKKNFEITNMKYLNIRDISFNYSIQPLAPVEQRKPVQFDLDIEKKINEEGKFIILLFNIQLKTRDRYESVVTGSYKSEHIFRIENFTDYVSKRGDLFEVDIDLNNALTRIAYSTVRGLLYQKFSGTMFSHFIMPLADPADSD